MLISAILCAAATATAGSACVLSGDGVVRVAVDSGLIFGYAGLTTRFKNSSIFQFCILDFKSANESYFEGVDVAVIDKPLLYQGYYSKFRAPKPPAFAIAESKMLSAWDNKLAFKVWLHTIGLGAFAAKTFDDSNVSFPCILKIINERAIKDHTTSGKTVHLVTGSNMLNEIIYSQVTKFNVHKAPRSRRSYFLEEPLTGQYEGTVYGSAFKGNLLALRCMVRVTPADGANKYRVLHKAGFSIYSTPCGTTIAQHSKRIVLAAAYTGTFCINFKPNASTQSPIYLENNPRICGTSVRNPKLFISMYLPLASAIQKIGYGYEASNCSEHWCKYWGITIHWLVFVEKLISETGFSAEMSVEWDIGRSEQNKTVPILGFNGSAVIKTEEYFVARANKHTSQKLRNSQQSSNIESNKYEQHNYHYNKINSNNSSSSISSSSSSISSQGSISSVSFLSVDQIDEQIRIEILNYNQLGGRDPNQ